MKFIYADMPAQSTAYVPVSDAINNLSRLTSFVSSSPLLPTAIGNAFKEAVNVHEIDPLCESIVVVANPSTALDAEQFSFNNVDTSVVSHITVLVPIRDAYHNKSQGFQNYTKGRSVLNEMANRLGGSYVEIPEKGNVVNGDESNTSLNTSGVSVISGYLNNMRSFAVDISHLAELYKDDKGTESFQITVKVQDAIVSTIDIFVPRDIFPTPEPTPEATVEAVETPEPITIRIRRGESGLPFRQAMYALIENYYLDENYLNSTSGKEQKSFDDEAQVAYDKFCELNDLPMTDGISEEGYWLLTDKEAKTRIIPCPTATPAPTATPSPTPVPIVPDKNLRLGDKDQDLPSNYIHNVQDKLRSLGCYLTESGSMTYTPGEFDQATMEALNTYCKAYSVNNSAAPYGASIELCRDILTGKREPIAAPSASIPKNGYKKGDTDENIPGGFIQAIQARLQALNCYATVDGELQFTPGVFDDATMQAITAYCDCYNVKNTVEEGISANLCQDILSTERARRETPTVPIVERIKNFLLQPIFTIGTFQVIMWMALVLCVVLVLGIVIIVIMMRSGDDSDISISNERRSRTPAKDQNPDEYNQLVTQAVYDSDKTMPEGADSTLPEGFGVPVSLRIEYMEKVRTENPIITSAYTIGRRDCTLLLDPADRSCSSKHAMLYVSDGQLFVRDLDSTNGTFVNGNRISKANDPLAALSDKTMILDDQDPQDQGYMLSRGDVIRMGKHRVTVNW